MKFPTLKYPTIHADPPWDFQNRSKKGEGRNAKRHYSCMSIDELAALPIDFCAAGDCVLLMWATYPMFPQALQLLGRWGFTYKTMGFTWVKTNPKSGTFFKGLGYWSRANPEPCLLATRGRPQRMSNNVDQLIVAPRRQHSRKPEETYGRIERLVAGPYLDLFSRQQRPGWDCWGNEVDKFKEAA